jgi:hypothetical protein
MMDKIAHSFMIDEAIKYGVEKSILLQHIRFWCVQNQGKETHEHDGLVYMYQSAQEMQRHYPYWSRQKISRLLRDMEAEGLIMSGNFNKVGYDQTKWYTITIECSDLNNRISKDEQPIPDTKTDTKPDSIYENLWSLYKRKGNKKLGLKEWRKLSDEDKEAVVKAAHTYIATRERQYQLDIQRYLNPTNRRWEDEIIADTPKPLQLGNM